MTKKIEDYLHLYTGCDIEFGFDGRKKVGQLVGKHEPYGWQVFDPSNAIVPYKAVRADLLKPILRPLSDMTEDEAKELLKIRYGKPGFQFNPIYEQHSSLCIDFKFEHEAGKFNHSQLDWDCLDSYSIHFLLSKHFDLFGLIEAGLAIDKTKL